VPTFVEKPITGSSSRLNNSLPAGHTLLPVAYDRWINRLAARHALKNSLKDISQSRPYDNRAQPDSSIFRSTREDILR
jgi:hypothetical protein